MEIPLFIDLRELEQQLGDDPASRPLKKLIRSVSLTHSCLADVSQAIDSLASLEIVPLRFDAHLAAVRRTIEGALVASAAILYARATAANGGRGERGSVSIVAELSPEQIADHDAIVNLRNRAIAHVYTNEAHADATAWHSEVVFAILDDGWRAGVTNNRLYRNTPMVARLKRQLGVARRILHDRFQTRVDQLTDLLNAHPMEDGEPWSRSFFNPFLRFGSPDNVKRILEGLDRGFDTFQTDSQYPS